MRRRHPFKILLHGLILSLESRCDEAREELEASSRVFPICQAIHAQHEAPKASRPFEEISDMFNGVLRGSNDRTSSICGEFGQISVVVCGRDSEKVLSAKRWKASAASVQRFLLRLREMHELHHPPVGATDLLPVGASGVFDP